MWNFDEKNLVKMAEEEQDAKDERNDEEHSVANDGVLARGGIVSDSNLGTEEGREEGKRKSGKWFRRGDGQ